MIACIWVWHGIARAVRPLHRVTHRPRLHPHHATPRAWAELVCRYIPAAVVGIALAPVQPAPVRPVAVIEPRPALPVPLRDLVRPVFFPPGAAVAFAPTVVVPDRSQRPVPEPRAAWLLGTAAAALVLLRRKLP